MEKRERNQIKVTVIVGVKIISVIIIGTGNLNRINGYFETKRTNLQTSKQKSAEVFYLIINTDKNNNIK